MSGRQALRKRVARRQRRRLLLKRIESISKENRAVHEARQCMPPGTLKRKPHGQNNRGDFPTAQQIARVRASEARQRRPSKP